MKHAIKIIAALSLLLGLSLGQINRQYQELERLTGRTHHFVPQPRMEFTTPPMGGIYDAERDIQQEIRRIERRCQKLNQQLQDEMRIRHFRSTQHGIVIEE